MLLSDTNIEFNILLLGTALYFLEIRSFCLNALCTFTIYIFENYCQSSSCTRPLHCVILAAANILATNLGIWWNVVLVLAARTLREHYLTPNDSNLNSIRNRNFTTLVCAAFFLRFLLLMFFGWFHNSESSVIRTKIEELVLFLQYFMTKLFPL